MWEGGVRGEECGVWERDGGQGLVLVMNVRDVYIIVRSVGGRSGGCGSEG